MKCWHPVFREVRRGLLQSSCNGNQVARRISNMHRLPQTQQALDEKGIPHIKILFERIGHQKPDIFGVMDLTAGYHQAPLYAPHRIFTACICFAGVFQFTRLPFGPCRAPSYFQEQMVTVVLYGLIYKCCEMYLDDCIVYGRGEAEFLKNLRDVFERFRLKGPRLKA